MKYIISLFAFLTPLFSASSQVNLTTSNLPIVVINTNGGQIKDEPKISAQMGIIYNGPFSENRITDAFNDFNGKIGIEYRGSTSQTFPKKPFGIEIWDENNMDINVSILGMPKESDWILNAVYNDKSMMRDMVTYILGGSVMEYATRGKYCELVLNGQYQGVYVFMEKIKRDKNRVNISKIDPITVQGDELTGGYIIKLDKQTGSNSSSGWISPYAPYQNANQKTYFQIEYPKNNDLNSSQTKYIKDHISNIESVIASNQYKDPIQGFRKYIDTKSLIDYIIMNELTKNPDAYRLSTYFFKEKDSDGGLIKFGPLWDYNLGFGNVNYCTGGHPEGLVIKTFNQLCAGDNWVIHFWWNRFLQDEAFYKDLKVRWKNLREREFSTLKIHNVIDSISNLLYQSQTRNFQKWPILGQYIWPNYYIGSSYFDEVNYLKNWTSDRLKWLDKEWELPTTSTEDTTNHKWELMPNPTSDNIFLKSNKPINSNTILKIYKSSGEQINLTPTLIENDTKIMLNTSGLARGLYVITLNNSADQTALRFIKI
jgi:hypothetical protein